MNFSKLVACIDSFALSKPSLLAISSPFQPRFKKVDYLALKILTRGLASIMYEQNKNKNKNNKKIMFMEIDGSMDGMMCVYVCVYVCVCTCV